MCQPVSFHAAVLTPVPANLRSTTTVQYFQLGAWHISSYLNSKRQLKIQGSPLPTTTPAILLNKYKPWWKALCIKNANLYSTTERWGNDLSHKYNRLSQPSPAASLAVSVGGNRMLSIALL